MALSFHHLLMIEKKYVRANYFFAILNFRYQLGCSDVVLAGWASKKIVFKTNTAILEKDI